MSIAVHGAAATPASLPMTAAAAEPPSWWSWVCPRCGRAYDAALDTCLADGTPLREVGCSMPFIWIG